MALNDEQINLVYSRLRQYNMSKTEILDEMADHICSLIEKEMNDGKLSFKEAFKRVISSFPNLNKINSDINSQAFGKYISFRNYLIVCIVIAILSFILKITHLPFVTITLAISVLLALFSASRLAFLMIKDDSFKNYRKIATLIIMLILIISYFVTGTFEKLHFQVLVLCLFLYQLLAIFHYSNKIRNQTNKLLLTITSINLSFLLFDYLELIYIINFNLMNLYIAIVSFQVLLFLPIVILYKLKNNLIVITGIILMSLYSIQSILILLKI